MVGEEIRIRSFIVGREVEEETWRLGLTTH